MSSTNVKFLKQPVPQALADSVVTDEHGKAQRLGDLWASRPIVLAFVRHFG